MYQSQRSRSNGAAGFWLGLACGAAAGAGAALLFAPKPGMQLRHDVTDHASRLSHTAQEKYGQASEVVADWVDRSRRAVIEGKRAFMSAKPNGMDVSV